MKKILTFIAALFVASHFDIMAQSGGTYSEKVVLETPDVIFRQIDEHTWEGNGHLMAAETVYLVEGDERAVLIDAGTRIKDLDTEIIVNVSGAKPEDYAAVCERLSSLDKIHAVEINISCPNVKQGGMAFGTTCAGAAQVVKAARAAYGKTLIVKLSPNVTDITEIARAVEAEGADAVSLVNTFLGMSIDVERRRPYLSTITGGLSGPCIRPIAVRMVWQTAKAVRIPVIGLGGIMNGRDALEFILAGATAVQVGTANFVDPAATMKIIDYIEDYMSRHRVSSVRDLIGGMSNF